MALVGSVNIKFGAQDAEYNAVLTKVRGANKRFVDETNKQNKSGYNQMLSDLNEQFGKRSALGKTLKLLAGGGVIGALGMAAGQVDELAKKAESLALAWNKGGQAMRDQAAELLRSVPIAGKLGDAFARIWELASGTTQYVAQLTTLTAATDLHTDAMAVRMRITNEWAHKTSDQFADISDSIGKMIRSGLPLKLFEIDADTRKAIQDLIDRADKAKAGADVAALEKKATELRKQISGMPTTIQKLQGSSMGGLNQSYATVPNPDYQAALAELKGTLAEIAKAKAKIDENLGTQKLNREFLGFAQKAKAYVEDYGGKLLDFFGRAKKANDDALEQEGKRVELWQKSEDAAERYRQKLDEIADHNRATFQQFQKSIQVQFLPQASVDERRTSFITPQRTDPTNDLRQTIAKVGGELGNLLQPIVDQLKKNPGAIIMTIGEAGL